MNLRLICLVFLILSATIVFSCILSNNPDGLALHFNGALIARDMRNEYNTYEIEISGWATNRNMTLEINDSLYTLDYTDNLYRLYDLRSNITQGDSIRLRVESSEGGDNFSVGINTVKPYRLTLCNIDTSNIDTIKIGEDLQLHWLKPQHADFVYYFARVTYTYADTLGEIQNYEYEDTGHIQDTSLVINSELIFPDASLISDILGSNGRVEIIAKVGPATDISANNMNGDGGCSGRFIVWGRYELYQFQLDD